MRPPTECRWSFPPPKQWNRKHDFIIRGADLEPDTLLYAYAHAMFPMFIAGPESDIGWWSPVMRGIIPLNGFHVSKSLRKSARRFRCSVNEAFTDVMIACAENHDGEKWIYPEFIRAYTELHAMGHAHSVEVWDENNELVGGVYGVRINNFFAGESMFHRSTDASKVALKFLVELMNLDGMKLFDTQWLTDHLETLGAIEIPRDTYRELLAEAVAE